MILNILVFVILYGAGMISSFGAHYFISGICLIAAALFLYAGDYRRTGNILNLCGLFTVFFLGGEGIACFKLSELETDWSLVTWACFFAAVVCFRTTYRLFEKRFKLADDGKKEQIPDSGAPGAIAKDTGSAISADAYANGIQIAAVGLAALSLGAFLFEAAVLGYVPLFVRGVPHAYSYFHVTGVHYITVSCVLVPSMAVLLMAHDGKMDPSGWLRKRAAVVIAAIVSFMIPLLCVSRLQLIFAVMFAVITYMNVTGRKKIRYVVAAAAAIIPFYLILTVARSHDVAYLNGIFEMKNADMPIFITQPYIYIANNYDNFNCLVEELGGFAYGMKGLFPLWTLSGIKFLIPEIVNYPIFVTKEELTTLTIFYDAYYDFGIFGVAFFSCLLGIFGAWVTRMCIRGKNPVWQLLFAQTALYFMLSFFTTWFSNPTTWFYFGVTAVFGILTEVIYRHSNKEEKSKV